MTNFVIFMDVIKTEVENKSKRELLQVAKSLFWKHGIRRVSVQEICQKAKISKMTFYRHFKNKEDIACQVIGFVQNASYKRYRHIMNGSSDFAVKVVELVRMKRADVAGISRELIQDIFENQEGELQSLIKDFQEKMLVEILEDFAKAQKKGQIRKDIKPEFILYMLNDMNKKLMDEQLQNIYSNEEELIMEMTNFFFYGLLP